MARPLKVLLGVTGGIAAYKAPELVRRLREGGHEVRCALTRGAEAFVSPLALEVVSGQPVYREEYLQAGGSGGEELHLVAARWADVLCVAPATCHTLARLALGLADDFVTTTALAFAGPRVLAPAMDSVMWSQEAVQQHVATLERRGARLVGPVVGPLASGRHGIGRLAEPEEIVQAVEQAAADRPAGTLAGYTVLVTAGPTREPLDPVRFLSNRSSGRMGFAMAAEAARRGARTLLVAGPVALPDPPGVERLDVATAAEMRDAVHALAPGADLIVMAAAVADFRPRRAAAGKLKKGDGPPRLELEPTDDILAGLAAVAPRAVRVGFAAETGDPEAEGRRKLAAKNVHFMVANDVSRADAGFESEDNEVTVLAPEAAPVRLGKRSKRRLAADLLDLFTNRLTRREPAPSPTRR